MSMDTLIVSVPPSTQLTDRQFYDLCLANPDLKIERTAQGELIFMPPTGGETEAERYIDQSVCHMERER